MTTTRFLISGFIFAGLLPGYVWAQSGLTAEQLGRLPLAFEKQGEGSQERFVARGQGYTVGVDGGKFAVGVAPKDDTGRAVSLEFVGARTGRGVPGGKLPGKVNYIRGNDPRKWQIGLETYERVTYPNAYPGIDLVYYGNQQQLEFDLLVKPGADPEAIRLKARGAGRLSIDSSGALSLGEAAGGFRLALPQIYQEVNGEKKRVPGRYAIVGRDEVAFRIDPWDRTRPLVIDPTVVFSVPLGGGLNASGGQAVAVDSSGNIIVAGYTNAADFPLLNPAQDIFNGSTDIFVTKINATGTALLFSTYYGGSSFQYAEGLALDSTGAAWVTGYTESTDLPTMNAAQSVYGGGFSDAFVAKFSSSGALQVSSYLGGDSSDYGYGIAVDVNKNAYVTGSTYGPFPTTTGVVQAGGGNGFVTEYSSTGVMEYSTEFGGAQTYGQAIAVDNLGDAYVTGSSSATTVPGMPAGGPQPTNMAGTHAYIAEFNPNATAYVHFTFLGGKGLDQGKAIAVDSSHDVFIAGQTSSPGLATTGAAYTTLTGATDGFVAKLDSTGSKFDYFTYLPGNRVITLSGMALDGSQNVYLTGWTDSTNFPAVLPLQSTLPGNGTSLFSSTNSGSTFTADDSNIPGAVFQISINPAGTSEVALTEAGIYRSTNGGTSWTEQFPTQFSSYGAEIARSPVAPQTIYAASCCSNIYRSTDDGVTWTYLDNTGSEAAGLVADPLTAGTVYLYGYTSPYVFRSIDGGKTWNPAAMGLPAEQVRSMVATSDGALYAAGFGFGIYKSMNQGGSWSAVNTGLPSNSYAYYPNSLSASGTTVYYADGTIYKTTNGGASWTPTAGYAGAYSVSVSAKNAADLYAFTFNNIVEESIDGGATWSMPAPSLPTNISYYISTLVADPSNPAHVLVIAPVNQAGFVAKLNSTGSALDWSTYLGSTVGASPYGMATDGPGNVLVTGYTLGGGFPVTSMPLPAGANSNAFITKISDATAACALTVDPESVLAPQYGGTLTFNVSAPSGCAWKSMTNEPSWVPITNGASGTGVGAVTIQATYNSTTATRTANLTIGAVNVTITQPADSCSFSLDKTAYPVPAAGGSVSVKLTATAGCPWMVTNNYRSAISFTTASSGTGSATIGMSVSSNPSGNQRSFYLLVGSVQIQIVQATAAPVITGISDAADNSAPPLAGGGLSILYGMNLAAGSVPATTIPWPFTLGGSTVKVNGVKAAMSYASPTQINFQMPYEVTAGAATIEVTNGDFTSQSFSVTILAASPGIFGSKILNTNGKLNTAANPIAAGGTAQIFYTGQGVAKPPVGDGQAAPATPVSVPVNAASATVGGLPAIVAFSGLVAGNVGVAQANVVIPAGLTLAGSYSVVITQNGRSSAAATIYVFGAAPIITKVTPLTVPVNSPPIQVTITGSNFGGGAMLQFTAPGGAITLIAPSAIQPTQITVTIPATLLTVEGAGKVGIDDGLGGVSNHFPFTITPPVATTTTLASSANPSVFGSLVKYKATVTPITAVGNMTISDGSFVFGTSPLVAGVAEFTTTLLPSGSQPIKADFSSSGGYLSSNSAVLTQVVKAAAANDFAAAVNSATGSGPFAIVVADFNNDGKADVAVTTASGVQVFLGKGDGTFGLPATYPSGYGTAITAGDFNRDGHTDLAVANGGTIYVLLGNGDGTFGAAVPFTVPSSYLVSIATGDFNSDGKLDLVAVNQDNGTVGVLLGNGDGTFEPAVSYNSGAEPSSVAIGDLNGDGRADLVVTNLTGSVNVLLGKGDGTFPTTVSHPTGNSPYRVVVADLNGDGKFDLAIANEYNDVSVLKGNGDGTFGPAAYYGASSDPLGIAVGDINGDGKPDIVISSYYSNSIAVLFGNGDLTFQTPVYYASGSNPQPVAIADFNSDGRSDVVAGNEGSSNLSVLLGLESTGPLFTSTLLTSFPNPSNVGQGVTLTARVSPSTATGSVTFKNGAAVLGAGTLSGGTATLYLSTLPAGTDSLTAVYPEDALKVYAPSTSPVLTQQVNKAPTNTALFSSLNPSDTGQSVTLRAVVSPSTATGSVIFRNGSTSLGTGTLSAGTAILTVSTLTAGVHALTAAYSGDAANAASTAALTQTVYAPRAATTTTQVSSSNPSTFGQAVTFTATVDPATPATGTVTLYDGVTVLETEPLVAGKATLKTSLLASGKREIRAFYDGDPTHLPSVSAALAQTVNAVAGNGFAPAVNYGTLTQPFVVAVGDFNGDGKADLAIGGYSVGGVSVLLGKGDGTFQAFVPYSTGGFISAIAVGDFNGDGKADLVVGTSNGVGVLLGKGDGTFQAIVNHSIGAATTYPQVLVTGDFNGDGHVDMATANTDGTLSVLLGAGDGTFAAGVNFGTAQYTAVVGLVTADFNGDGIPDLATAGGGSLRIFLGNGDGSFHGGFTSTSAYYQAYSFVAADFNGDGKTDLAIPTGSTVYVLLGKGDGTFLAPVPYNAGTNEFEAQSAAIGDFNGDGKVDLVVADYGATGSANVLLGNGDGTFQPPVNHTVGTTPYSVAVADFNGDGRADIVTANYGSSNVSILLGTLTPTVNSVTPSSTLVGSPATAVTIAGSNFLAGATVSWKSPGGQVTAITPSVVKPGQISATIPTTLLGTAGTAEIAATNGVNELSNQVPFYILPFRITSVTPDLTPAGSAATKVTVAGTNLSTAATLSFTPPGGTAVSLPLSSLSPTTAVATIPSMYLATAGTAQVALANAAGAISNPLQFYITPFTITTVTPNATPAGSAATKVTVAGTNLSTATSLAFTPPGAGAPFMIALSTVAAGQAVATIPVGYLTTAGAAQVALANGAGALSNPLPFTITVGPSPQTITFAALIAKTVGDPAFTVSATVSSGLTATFKSNSTSVCTVLVATVTLLTDGTCSLTASQPGTASYAPAAPVTQTFNVAGKPQSITFGPLKNMTLTGAAPPPLSATATSGLTVAFASNSPTICGVTGVTVTLLKTGTCSITASQGGSLIYAPAATVTQTFTVLGGS